MFTPVRRACFQVKNLNYLDSFDYRYESTWWSFQKHFVCTKLDIYV